MRFIQLFLFIIFTGTSFLAHAESWLDKVKSGYAEVEQRLATTHQDDPALSAEAELVQAKALPTDLPPHWQFSYFSEPEFNSQLVVLETGRQHKQSILLVHGLGQLGMKDWFDVVPFLEQRYHVIALDLPGFGFSAVPKGRYSPTNYARVLAAVAQQYAQQPLIVIGHSMGAAVSLRFASMYPEKIYQLILVDAAGILEKTAFVKHLGTVPVDDTLIPERFKKKWAQLNDLSGSLIEFGTLNDPASKFLQKNDMAWQMLLSSAPNMNAALSLVDEDFSQAVRAVKIPVDMIWGEQDSVAPIRTAKVLAQALPHSRLQVIHGAGHVPMKSHSQQFLAALHHSLSTAMVAKSAIIPAGPSQSQSILHCIDQDNGIYTGDYELVLLERCSNVKLVDLTTQKMIIKDSLVEAENLLIGSKQQALFAEESVLRVTNAHIQGKDAIRLSGSRIDMAGVSIEASAYGVYADSHSQVILSISDMSSRYYQGLLHGAFELEAQSLDLLYRERQ